MTQRISTAIATTLVTLLSSLAQASTFQSVVVEKSSIGFSYRQMGVAMVGKFQKFNAQLQLDTSKADKAKGSIDIDLASVDTGSSEADQEVAGKAWFNVAAYPKASFVLRQLTATGPNQFQATGQLTLKGQTRELSAPLKLSPQGMLTGSLVLKRADFGIGEGMWAKFDVVANEITVNFNLNLK